ncbi:MAG: DMT family transporter [Pseudomonadota bacterium]
MTAAEARPNRLTGVLLMVGATVCWSTGGLIVRNLSVVDGWEIVFWRSLFMSVFLAALLAVWHRGRMLVRIRGVGWAGAFSGLMLAATFFSFILALTLTTVANTHVIMALQPFVTALISRLLLHERVAAGTWLMMAAALAGIAVMSADSLGSGGLAGIVVGLVMPLAMAVNLVMLRRFGQTTDMVPTVLLAGLYATATALPIAWPLMASARDIALLAVMGFFQVGLGCLLVTLAIRHLSAPEVGLLALLEVILGPLWVWLGIGEQPSALALAGGLIVVAAVVANQLLGLLARRR